MSISTSKPNLCFALDTQKAAELPAAPAPIIAILGVVVVVVKVWSKCDFKTFEEKILGNLK